MDYTLILTGSDTDDFFGSYKCIMRFDPQLLEFARSGIDCLKNNPKIESVMFKVEPKDVFFAHEVPDEILGEDGYVDEDLITTKFDWEQYRDLYRAANAPEPCGICPSGPSESKCEICENRESGMNIDEAVMALDQIYNDPLEFVEMHIQVTRMHVDNGTFELYFRSSDADEDEPNSSDYWTENQIHIEEIERAIKLLEDGKNFVELEKFKLPF